jgi:beta-1,4-mannosyltransferase
MTARTTERRPAVTVLQSFPRPRSTTNPYLVQLVRALPDDVRIEYFSWRRALAGRYDVLHLHWPETLLRSPSRVKALARTAAGALLLGVLRARRIAVVRTLHNPRPHEQPPPLARAVLRGLDRATTRWIRLNTFTVEPDPARTSTILHGHYRDWFGTTPSRRCRAACSPSACSGRTRVWSACCRLFARGSVTPSDEPARRGVADETPDLREDGPCSRCPADPRITARLAHRGRPAPARRDRPRRSSSCCRTGKLHNSGAALLAAVAGANPCCSRPRRWLPRASRTRSGRAGGTSTRSELTRVKRSPRP